MPSQRDIRRRIGSVKNIKQITRAMQFVAAPILGNLSDRYGRRRVILFAVGALGIANRATRTFSAEETALLMEAGRTIALTL